MTHIKHKFIMRYCCCGAQYFARVRCTVLSGAETPASLAEFEARRAGTVCAGWKQSDRRALWRRQQRLRVSEIIR
jgi:hypothetical protein